MGFLSERILKYVDKGALNSLSQAGSIGLHMVSGTAVGGLIGYFLDKWLDTRPWLTLVFLVVGIIAGFRNVYLDTKRLIRAQEREAAEEERRRANDSKHPPEN